MGKWRLVLEVLAIVAVLLVAEVRQQMNSPRKSRCRLLIRGPEVDDPALYELVESLGANVVADDTCIGTRFFSHDVEKTDDPVEGLSRHYLRDIYCPLTTRGKGEGWRTREHSLAERFGHVIRLAKDLSVDGIILCVMKFCDLHELDVPDLRDYLQGMGFPVLHIETDYSMAAVAGLRTST
jgi:benzoyl-CoA reductase/2-hydroxyglutaryl-CoA dehydratase subunit BcrC/BadD/HgdB